MFDTMIASYSITNILSPLAQNILDHAYCKIILVLKK